MDGKPLSVCPICNLYPCKCNGSEELELVRLTYRVGEYKFVVWIPKSLVDQYKSLYEEFEVMNADGSVVVYSSGGGAREKSNENQ
tara:strand:+ start:708 stop:962 length:255 start_codon:yes stop_codon:yes gene_type:complete